MEDDKSETPTDQTSWEGDDETGGHPIVSSKLITAVSVLDVDESIPAEMKYEI